jgi:hypothetical protein
MVGVGYGRLPLDTLLLQESLEFAMLEFFNSVCSPVFDFAPRLFLEHLNQWFHDFRQLLARAGVRCLDPHHS